MALTQQQIDDFHRDGYLIVPDVFDAAEVGAALAAMEQIFYGKSYAEYLAGFDENPAAVSDGFCSKGAPGRAQFPCGPEALDCMIEKDEYLDMCEQLLGTDQISYNNAHLFMRSGPTDSRHAAEPWQGYHIDHATNCLLPPADATGYFDYLNSGVYLHDVEDDGAPMHVIPGSHRLVAERLPQWIKEGKFTGHNEFLDIRVFEEFGEPVPMTAK
ncbi:MAG TPA: phytanoyl-CoA dioxygenase family protein, partial [Abditibacteriaceae bacterium]|nr:phytanoyl-CoA dioxygenase family protein [Abditibacteriaceae bacterium]